MQPKIKKIKNKQTKSTVTKILKDFDKLNTAKERISELEDMPIETSQTEMQSNRRTSETKPNIQELWDNFERRGTHTTMWMNLKITTLSESQTKKEYMLCNSIYRTF